MPLVERDPVEASELAFAWTMASRSEPVPLSCRLVTANDASSVRVFQHHQVRPQSESATVACS